MICKNILIVGDAGVGKTTFINRWNAHRYTREYLATQHTQIYESKYNGNIFNIIDSAGQYKYSNIQYHGSVDCAIIMFDVQSNISYKSISYWYDKIIQHYGYIPIVICGNKVDITNRKVRPDMINRNWTYFDISAKSMYNLDKPFMTFIR